MRNMFGIFDSNRSDISRDPNIDRPIRRRTIREVLHDWNLSISAGAQNIMWVILSKFVFIRIQLLTAWNFMKDKITIQRGRFQFGTMEAKTMSRWRSAHKKVQSRNVRELLLKTGEDTLIKRFDETIEQMNTFLLKFEKRGTTEQINIFNRDNDSMSRLILILYPNVLEIILETAKGSNQATFDKKFVEDVTGFADDLNRLLKSLKSACNSYTKDFVALDSVSTATENTLKTILEQAQDSNLKPYDREFGTDIANLKKELTSIFKDIKNKCSFKEMHIKDFIDITHTSIWIHMSVFAYRYAYRLPDMSEIASNFMVSLKSVRRMRNDFPKGEEWPAINRKFSLVIESWREAWGSQADRVKELDVIIKPRIFSEINLSTGEKYKSCNEFFGRILLYKLNNLKLCTSNEDEYYHRHLTTWWKFSSELCSAIDLAAHSDQSVQNMGKSKLCKLLDPYREGDRFPF